MLGWITICGRHPPSDREAWIWRSSRRYGSTTRWRIGYASVGQRKFSDSTRPNDTAPTPWRRHGGPWRCNTVTPTRGRAADIHALRRLDCGHAAIAGRHALRVAED